MATIYKPNVIRGGKAIPLGNNFYYMQGRKHESGGIDVGKDLEVEGGEIMQMGGKSLRVFSSVPFLGGKSPAKRLLDGENPNKVFAAQENFKDRNKLNDDGTKKAKFGLEDFITGQKARDVDNDTIISQCAKWQNQQLRRMNVVPGQNAWQPAGKKIFSGYNENNKPKKYSKEEINTYNQAAADSLYRSFNTDNMLDTAKVYTANMYYKDSPAQEEAYKNGYDNLTGTHTGYVKFNQKDKRWKLYHNIHGTIHADDFKKTQGSNRKYGVTAIYEPRENTRINRFKDRVSAAKNRISNNITNLFK